MKRILVPCDFSQTAQNAYTLALDIAKKSNAEIFVVKAIEIPFTAETSFVESYQDIELMRALEEKAREDFKKMKGQHTKQDEITFEVVQGSVTPVIRDYINNRKIDLVVTGTNGASGLSGVLIGSNTEKIVRLSSVPVLTVRRAIKLASIRNIVFATALDHEDQELITKVKELQAFFEARLHILRVNTLSNFWDSSNERREMKEFVKANGLTNCTVNFWNDYYEQDGIIQFAKDIAADMIAMGTHGRRGLNHLFNGSLAEEIVNSFDIPIWTYRLKKAPKNVRGVTLPPPIALPLLY